MGGPAGNIIWVSSAWARSSFRPTAGTQRSGSSRRHARTFAAQAPRGPRSPGSQQGPAVLGGTPARPVINRQEVTLLRVLRSVSNGDGRAPVNGKPHTARRTTFRHSANTPILNIGQGGGGGPVLRAQAARNGVQHDRPRSPWVWAVNRSSA